MSHIPFAQLTGIIVFDAMIAVVALGWSIWSAVRRRHVASGPGAVGAGVLAGGAAVLLLVSVVLPWGRARGDVDRIPLLAVNARPADTLIGSSACFLTAVVAACFAIAILRGRLPRALLVGAILVASAWVALCVDVVLGVSAVDDVAGLVGGERVGHAAVGPAVWLTVVAGLALLAATAVGCRGSVKLQSPVGPPAPVSAPPLPGEPATGGSAAFRTGDQW